MTSSEKHCEGDCKSRHGHVLRWRRRTVNTLTEGDTQRPADRAGWRVAVLMPRASEAPPTLQQRRKIGSNFAPLGSQSESGFGRVFLLKSGQPSHGDWTHVVESRVAHALVLADYRGRRSCEPDTCCQLRVSVR